MKYWPLFGIAGAGVLFAWLVPQPAQEAATVAPAPSQAPAPRDDTVMLATGGDLELDRASDGHFYADVSADAGTAHMLVDTGASLVALTGEDAEAMGIAWDPAQVGPVARGAAGTVYGVRVTIERMELGDFEATDVQAIVVPEGMGISLLGQSFLSQVPRVEIDRDRMVLGS